MPCDERQQGATKKNCACRSKMHSVISKQILQTRVGSDVLKIEAWDLQHLRNSAHSVIRRRTIGRQGVFQSRCIGQFDPQADVISASSVPNCRTSKARAVQSARTPCDCSDRGPQSCRIAMSPVWGNSTSIAPYSTSALSPPITAACHTAPDLTASQLNKSTMWKPVASSSPFRILSPTRKTRRVSELLRRCDRQNSCAPVLHGVLQPATPYANPFVCHAPLAEVGSDQLNRRPLPAVPLS